MKACPGKTRTGRGLKELGSKPGFGFSSVGRLKAWVSRSILTDAPPVVGSGIRAATKNWFARAVQETGAGISVLSWLFLKVSELT